MLKTEMRQTLAHERARKRHIYHGTFDKKTGKPDYSEYFKCCCAETESHVTRVHYREYYYDTTYSHDRSCYRYTCNHCGFAETMRR